MHDRKITFLLKIFLTRTQTYVVGTQKNRLNETVFEHPKQMLKFMGNFTQKLFAYLILSSFLNGYMQCGPRRCCLSPGEAVSALCLIICGEMVDLWSVIVEFPGNAHLLFNTLMRQLQQKSSAFLLC